MVTTVQASPPLALPADLSTLSRRAFIRQVTFATSALALGPALLAACGGASTAAPSESAAAKGAAGGGGVKLPTYVPFANGPKPDLPGNAQGLDPAYYKFPSKLVQTVPKPPGDGSTVTAVTYLTLSAPPPVDRNVAWQTVNKAINANLNLTMVPAADYNIRLSTVLAGSDLPDFIYNPTNISPTGIIPALPQFAQSKCSDLTPYLSGDAVKNYPNLAHFSTYTWRSGVIEGKIYALPVARPPIGGVIMYRSDLFQKAGITINNAPKDADEFKRMLLAVNNPKGNQWAIAAGATSYFALNSNNAFLGIFNVPNNWKLDAGGKLVKDFETEEYKAAIGFAQDLWKAGVWHPNTPTYGGAFNGDFMAGRFAVAPGVWGQYVQLWDIEQTIQPEGRIYPMHPFAHDGGKPAYPAGSGNFGYALIKKQSSAERLKMLLGIANFFAAPFGSTEWLLNYYGVKGVDFNYNADGAPVFTDKGRAELTVVWRYITSPAYALFDPVRSQQFADVSHKAEEAMMAALSFDPTLGFYSESSFRLGIPAQTAVYAAVGDIVQGRRPLSDWSSIVGDWRTKAGDKMRAEFQSAIEKSKQ